jgi:hypothetical protein
MDPLRRNTKLNAPTLFLLLLLLLPKTAAVIVSFVPPHLRTVVLLRPLPHHVDGGTS